GSAESFCSADGIGAGGVDVEAQGADGLGDQVGAVDPVVADVLGFGSEDVERAVGVENLVALLGVGVGGGAGDACARLGVGRPYGRLLVVERLPGGGGRGRRREGGGCERRDDEQAEQHARE